MPKIPNADPIRLYVFTLTRYESCASIAVFAQCLELAAFSLGVAVGR